MKAEKPQYTSESIHSLESRDHVRMRPQMYFEKVYAEKSLDRFPLETACHAFDKAMSKKCNYLKIELYSDHFSIEYDAGMSLKREHDISHAEIIMTQMRACHNLKEHLVVGDRFCEVGIMTINAASDGVHFLPIPTVKKVSFHLKKEKPKRALSAAATKKKIILN